MNNELYGDLSIISTKGNEDFALQVDNWIRQWRYEEAVSKTQELGGGDTTHFDTDISVDSFFDKDRKSTRLNSSHDRQSRMPSSA